MKTKMQLSALLACFIALSALPAAAQHHPTPGAAVTGHAERHGARVPTHLYDALVGEWDVYAADGDESLMVIRAKWGPGHSYLSYEGSFLAGAGEQPHFAGIFVWNGISRKMDMLLSADMERGLMQESGTLVTEDGVTFERTVLATYSEGAQSMTGRVGAAGATAHFRQTYRFLSADTIETATMRKTDNGWVPTFPGSDALVMKRRHHTRAS